MTIEFVAQGFVDLRDYFPYLLFLAAIFTWVVILMYVLYMLAYFRSPGIRRWNGHGFDVLPPK